MTEVRAVSRRGGNAGAIVVRCFAVIGMLLCGLTVLVILRLDIFGRLISDRILANAAKPTEREMPPTPGGVPYSSSDIQVVGGRGEGLSCSLPYLLDFLAFRPGIGRSAIGLEMRQACVTHDYCYRHGAATYGYTQADCDFILQEQAFRLCSFIEKFTGDESIVDKDSKCIHDARLVTFGVRLGGSDSFRSNSPKIAAMAQGLENEEGVDGPASTYFEYDPFPVRAGNYSVYRIADAPSSFGREPRKSIYKFSIRPSGTFISEATEAGALKLLSVLPGDPAYMVTPPLVLRSKHESIEEDWFVWWQRRDLVATRGRIMAIAPGRATNEDWNCLYLAGMADAQREQKASCTDASTAVVITNIGTKEEPDDPHISELLPAHQGRTAQDILRLIALQTQSCEPGGGSAPCFRDISISTVSHERRQPQLPLHITDSFSPERKGEPHNEDNRYRDYVSRPVILKPSPLEEPILTLFRRDDDNYQSTAFVRRIGISKGLSRGSLRLADGELDDPFFVAGPTQQKSFLVSLRRSMESGVGRVEVLQWFLPEPTESDDSKAVPIEPNRTKCSPTLDGTWLARPPVVLPTTTGGALVVLSRAVETAAKESGDAIRLAIFVIEPNGGCEYTLEISPPISLKRLVPGEALSRKRLEFTRKAPILVGDLDNDGGLDVIFPGAGANPVASIIARIAHFHGAYHLRMTST
jgi:hypothetical protein